MGRRHSSARPAHRTRAGNDHTRGSSPGANMPTAVRPCEHRNDSSDMAVVALYICIFLTSTKSTPASRGETRKLDVASMCINYDRSHSFLLWTFGSITFSEAKIFGMFSFSVNGSRFVFHQVCRLNLNVDFWEVASKLLVIAVIFNYFYLFTIIMYRKFAVRSSWQWIATNSVFWNTTV